MSENEYDREARLQDEGFRAWQREGSQDPDSLAEAQKRLRAMDTIDNRVGVAVRQGARMSAAGKALIRKTQAGTIAFHCALLHDITDHDGPEDEIWDDVIVIVLPGKRWRSQLGGKNNTHGFRTSVIMQTIGAIPGDDFNDFDEIPIK